MWFVVHPEDLLFIVCLPVDVDESFAVHTVDVEDPIQVVHLVLEDTSGPATGLPCDSFTLLVQTCRVNMQRDQSNIQKCISNCPIMCLLIRNSGINSPSETWCSFSILFHTTCTLK